MEHLREYFIYLRLDNRFKCPTHWESASDSNYNLLESAWTCEDCLGFGVKTTPAIVLGRLSLGSAGIGSMGGDVIQEPGIVSRETEVLHFPRAVYPKSGDVVIRCEWDKDPSFMKKFPKPRPIRIVNIWQLKDVTSYWWREVSYFSCGITDFMIIANHIKRLLPVRFANLDILDVSLKQSYW